MNSPNGRVVELDEICHFVQDDGSRLRHQHLLHTHLWITADNYTSGWYYIFSESPTCTRTGNSSGSLHAWNTVCWKRFFQASVMYCDICIVIYYEKVIYSEKTRMMGWILTALHIYSKCEQKLHSNKPLVENQIYVSWVSINVLWGLKRSLYT